MKSPSLPTRARLVRITAIVAFVYLLAVLLLVVGESSMVYRPLDGPATPQATGLAHFTLKTLPQANRPPIVYWENDAPANAPTILYFHGNLGGLYMHKPNLAFFNDAKLHVIAMEYPGYPGTEGNPSETLIVNDATTLYDAVTTNKKHPPAIWGYSLGSGVAVQLAARREPSALVLEAPFTGVVDRAGELFPYAPVQLLMKNQFRSRDYIAQVHAPLLIMHGTADMIIPIHHGRDLFALANQPKTFKHYEGGGHLNLIKYGAYQDADRFIRTRATAH